MVNGGQLLINGLEQLGATRVYCVPGESYLPALDALYDSDIATVVCRQEGGASMMAEAHGKLHGQPGICFVTRGPGATNALSGFHVAAQDSTPLILFIGQVSSDQRYREGFQEVDYGQLLGGMAKWVAQIDHVERIPELLSRAWHTACSGRPGPVAIVLPEDTLTATCDNNDTLAWQTEDDYVAEPTITTIENQLSNATNPIAILGGSGWSAKAVKQFTAFAERLALPVACSFRRQMLFDHTHPNYAGDVGLGINPQLTQLIDQADTLLLVGCRLSEIPSQNFTLLNIPIPKQSLIHIHPGADELNRIYKADIAIQSTPAAFCRSLEASHSRATAATQPSGEKQQRLAQASKHYHQWSSLDHCIDEVELMKQVMQYLKENLPDDAIITNGAGNYASWVHRFWQFRHYGTQISPTSGSMGYGLPAAISAKLSCPDKKVVAFAGDGCFQMTCQELATAMQENAAVIVLVIDNCMYGTIRMHQEKHFPDRVIATSIVNPDFAQLANSYGAYSATIEKPDDIAAAITGAIESDTAALVHIKTNPSAITPTQSL